MLKAAGFVVLAAVVAVAAGVVTRRGDVVAVVQPVATSTPTPTPTPKRSVSRLPPNPTPTVAVEATRPKAIVANRLYSQGKLPAVSCSLPATAPLTKSELLSHARVMVKCLDRAWKPVITAAKVKFRPVAEVQVYDERKPASSQACVADSGRAGAFYWSAEETICINWPEFVDDGDPILNEAYFRDTVAHEYGHHVQNLVGILDVYDLGHRKKPTKAIQLEDERRLELQANCFSGVFLGANRASLNMFGVRYLEWKYAVQHQGDELFTPVIRDHGSAISQAYWTIAGFDRASPAACNTFVAQPHEVE
jgi:predicted metalloprotease